jgi:hypothetical protein
MMITRVEIDGVRYHQRPWLWRDWMGRLPWGIRVRIWKFAFPQSTVDVHLHPWWA